MCRAQLCLGSRVAWVDLARHSQLNKTPVYNAFSLSKTSVFLVGRLYQEQNANGLHPAQYPADTANVCHAGGTLRGAALRVPLDRRDDPGVTALGYVLDRTRVG